MTSKKTVAPILTFMVAILVFQTTSVAQTPVANVSLDSVPSNATAFVHVDLVKLFNTPGWSEPCAVVNGVKDELDELIQKNIGIKISDLHDATFVVPAIDEELMEGFAETGNPSGFGLFGFAEPVETGFAEKHLPRSWRPVKIGSHLIFVDKDSELAVFHSSPKVIALGSEKAVRWFLEFTCLR